MAIRKEKRLSPLKDKKSKKKEDDRVPDLSYEAGIDAQKEQINTVPKKTEEWQNTDDESKLKKKSD